jgi:hypothetical protein
LGFSLDRFADLSIETMERLDPESEPSTLALVAPNPCDSPVDEDGGR